MGLIAQAQDDIRQITNDLDGFGSSLSFVAPTAETITINGLFTKHHTNVDTEGRPINTKNASIAFAESLMDGYPVRDSGGEVNLKGHTVTATDSTGNANQYIIREWFPDETIGLIVCILGDFE